MPGVDLTVRIVDHVTPALQGKARALTSFRVPLKQAQVYMLGSIDRNFRADGRPKWRPLSEVTILRRRKGSSRPLQDTGRLRASVTPRGGAGAVRTVTDAFALIGTHVDYASKHQFGTPRIPRRSFLLFQDEDQRRIVTIFKRYIEGA